MPTAFAMALGVPVAEIIDALGDGQEIICPDLPPPTGQRGYHIQELIHYAVKLGYSVTPFERVPELGWANGHTLKLPGLEWGFNYIVATTRGVIEGETHRCRHMVAYEDGIIYDPRGSRYTEPKLHDFSPICAWRII